MLLTLSLTTTTTTHFRLVCFGGLVVLFGYVDILSNQQWCQVMVSTAISLNRKSLSWREWLHVFKNSTSTIQSHIPVLGTAPRGIRACLLDCRVAVLRFAMLMPSSESAERISISWSLSWVCTWQQCQSPKSLEMLVFQRALSIKISISYCMRTWHARFQNLFLSIQRAFPDN